MDAHSYEKRLSELATRLEYTFAAYAIWGTLRDAYRHRITATSKYDYFFRLLLVISLEHARLNVVATFERDKGSAGFPALIEAARQSRVELAPHLEDRHFEQLDAVRDQCDMTVSKIKKLRNAMAHLKVDTDIEPYEVKEREELLEKMKRMYQILFSGFKGFNPIVGEEDKYSFRVEQQVKVATERILQVLNGHDE